MNLNRASRRRRWYPASVSTESFVIPFWWRMFVVVGAMLLALGGIIALVNPSMLISPHDEITHGVKIYAGYLATRSKPEYFCSYSLRFCERGAHWVS